MPYFSPVLDITDGTQENTISLINPANGYILCDWSPAAPTVKYDYSVDGSTGLRRPVGYTYESIIDSFTLNVRDTGANAVIAWEKKFQRILMEASRFWTSTGVSRRPYYLRVRAKNESTIRYAVIHSISLPGSGNPFAQPFASNSKNKAITNLVVNIEHDLFSTLPPAQVTALGVESYIDDIYEGRGITGNYQANFYDSAEEPYGFPDYEFAAIANHGAIAALDYAIRGGDLVDLINDPIASPPQVFPNTTNYTYFGIGASDLDDSINKHRFTNIVLIPSRASDGYASGTISAQYWNGLTGAWTTLNIRDTSVGMARPGIVSWSVPNNWSPTTYDSKYGMWVRLKRTGGVANSTLAQTVPYTASWGHIKISSASHGTAGARVDIKFTQNAWGSDTVNLVKEIGDTVVKTVPNRVLIGGADRLIYNFVSPQYSSKFPYSTDAVLHAPQTSGITTTNFTWSDMSAYQRVMYTQFTSNASVSFPSRFIPIACVTFLNNQTGMYSGNFRVFARLFATFRGGTSIRTMIPSTEPRSTSMPVKFMARFGNRAGRNIAGSQINVDDTVFDNYESKISYIPNMLDYVYSIDLGVIPLGGSRVSYGNDSSINQTITLYAQSDTSRFLGARINILDIVLIPVDDFLIDISVPNSLTSSPSDYSQDVFVTTASSLGVLDGYVVESARYLSDPTGDKIGLGPQRRYANLSFPVGNSLYFDTARDTYLYAYSYRTEGGVSYSVPSDVYNIEMAGVPMFYTSIGDIA